MVSFDDTPQEAVAVTELPVEPTGPTNLDEAHSQFVAEKKNSKRPALDGQSEIIRFIDWYGRDRRLNDLSPSLIEEYAREFSQRGAEAHKRLSPVKEFLKFLNQKQWTEINLSTHLRASRARRTGNSRQGVAQSRQATGPRLSEEGYQNLVEELEKYKGEKVKADQEVKDAMAGKDFRENAPLDAAKERQGFVAAKITELESEVANAQILSGDEDTSSGKRAVIGSSITIRKVDSGDVINYTLVDKREADVASGKISTVSPVGQALLDKTVGETVEITVPRGTVSFVIEKIGA